VSVASRPAPVTRTESITAAGAAERFDDWDSNFLIHASYLPVLWDAIAAPAMLVCSVYDPGDILTIEILSMKRVLSDSPEDGEFAEFLGLASLAQVRDVRSPSFIVRPLRISRRHDGVRRWRRD